MQRKYDENHWPSTLIEIKLANQNLNQKVKTINLIGENPKSTSDYK